MADKVYTDKELLPHLFRLEYTKMTAVLCRLFGIAHIEIAEDIASDTFMKAVETWGSQGIPQNPTAWLYTVAKNKTKDYLKRNTLFEQQVKTTVRANAVNNAEIDVDFTPRSIGDSQLRMIFAVCDPINGDESQICLALQILCGFSVEEIANAFLTNKETIRKRLFRARELLRNINFKLQVLQSDEIVARLQRVLRTLYLLFSEGYFSKSGNELIRKDLCLEAFRLTFILTENALTNVPETNALLSLMCFQSSRLDARMSRAEEALSFDEQDRNLWDRTLIEKGNYYLLQARSKNVFSKYHIEASIAYWHTTSSDDSKWPPILLLYNELLVLEYSSSVALNRTFAFAKVYGPDKAIGEAQKLNLSSNHFYHALLGYLYATLNPSLAVAHYNQAIALATSEAERKLLRRASAKLNNNLP